MASGSMVGNTRLHAESFSFTANKKLLNQDKMNALILMVGDEKKMTDSLYILRNEYVVFKAPDAGAALEFLHTRAIHLVISDAILPGVDGFELCSCIKTNYQFSHIPVILLTEKNTEEGNVRGLEMFADVCIERPYSGHHLLAQIRSLLSNRNIIRQYFANFPFVYIHNMAHSIADEKFLNRLNEIIHDNITDSEFDVEKLARMMTMSRATLYRKIKAVSDLTPNELINVTRLKKAAELLATEGSTIREISLSIGYDIQSNFSRDFNKQFGITPSKFIRNLHHEVVHTTSP